jgi:eukaryotic-like serine/threonine-protein kinase
MGMGTVFLANDTRFDRPVAVKLISGETVSGATRARFQQEVKVASSLNHPHILTVHDVGELDGARTWSPSALTAARCASG